ncbi:ABC transporter G family member STR2-like [Cryptomeria japonica]|uniref:ABC transporter G family member STR2-like n=1 Tax=Cryptomeria japonica TaxID=3369 RepID=UPI0027DAA385|nr:ABC transporter G family member STR2-like [Cryptomeria japonica]
MDDKRHHRGAVNPGTVKPSYVVSKPSKQVTGGLEFRNLTYTVIKKQKVGGKWVAEEIDLLHKITGHAPKGSITAVMGPSGAGKSTFLDGLAGRIASGSLRGTVAMDGQEMSPSFIKRTSAYVMQDDRLFPMLTVYETLMYAAEFRLGQSVRFSEKEARVEKLIDQLGLTNARNTYIGNEEVRGVSGGERRRVSIGVDIIHGPALLFLDEPTSGLDSSSAHSVIEKVHDVAMAGRVVILTIHQPSHRIISLLDNLIVLARGHLIYQGSPKGVGTHLSNMARNVPKGENSIECLLDVIAEYDRSSFTVSALAGYYYTKVKPPSLTKDKDIDISLVSTYSISRGMDIGSAGKMALRSPSVMQMHGEACISVDIHGEASTNFDSSIRTPRRKKGGAGLVEAFNFTPMKSSISPSYVESIEVISSNESTPHGSDCTVNESDYFYKNSSKRHALDLGPKFPNSFGKEVLILIKRNFENIKRTPELFLSRQVVLTVMGAMLATMFLKPKADVQGMTNVLSFFISTVCLFFFSSNDAVPAFIQERFIFIRETSHNAYRASSYAIAGLITYLPFLFIQALTYFIIVWFPLNLRGDFYYFVLLLFVSLITTNSFVVFVSSLVPNYIMGYAAVIAFTAIFFLFCGFFIPGGSIPVYWKWMHYISTIKYSYEGMIMNEYSRSVCYSFDETGNCALNRSQILTSLSISTDKMDKWVSLAYLLAWAVIYRIFFYVILRFNSKNQRK